MNDKEIFHVKRQNSFPGFAKNDFDLSTQARPYRLTSSALPSEFGGS